MAKAVKLTGGAKLHADLQKTIEKQGIDAAKKVLVNVLNLARPGSGYEVKTYGSTTPTFAMFFKGKPVSEEECIKLILKALSESKLPIEEDILIADINDLPPDKKTAWIESGFKATSWSGGVVSKVNQRLSGNNNAYIKKRNAAADANRLMELATRTDPDDLTMWRAAAIEFVETHNLHMNASSKGLKLVLEVVDEQLLLESMISYDLYNKTLRFFGKNSDPVETEFKLEPPLRASDFKLEKGDILTSSSHMGHTDADSTQQLRRDRNILQDALDIAIASNHFEAIDIYKVCLDFLDIIIHKQENIDKIFISTEALLYAKADLAAQFDALIEASASLGADEVTLVYEADGKIYVKTGKVSLNLSASVFNAEPGDPNSWKGAKQASLVKMWNRFLENTLTSKEVLSTVISAQNSSSFLTTFIIKNLAEMFDEKDLLKVLKLPKGKNLEKRINIKKKKRTHAASKIAERLKAQENRIAKARHQLKNPPTKVRKFLKGTKSAKVSNTPILDRSIISKINSDIKRYVIEQMNYPSLENRTGRFASSVVITDILEDRLVRYIYRKNPYKVFSMTEGRTPWATPHRDPDKIIDTAIKKLMQDKYGVLVTTEGV